MISSGRSKMAAVAGLVLIFAVVLLFMRLFPGQERARMTSLAFIVVGIALPFAGYIWVEDTQAKLMGPGMRAGVYSLFFVYGLSAVSMAVVLMLLGVGAGLIATLETVLALVFVAVLAFAAVVGGERVKSRSRAMESVAFMRALEEDIYRMAQDEGGAKHSGRLRRLGEAVKYSDHSGLTGVDDELGQKVRELKYALREDAGPRTGGPGRPYGADSGGGADGQDGPESPDSARRDAWVDALTEDILKLIESRNRELINEKKARSLSHG